MEGKTGESPCSISDGGKSTNVTLEEETEREGVGTTL